MRRPEFPLKVQRSDKYKCNGESPKGSKVASRKIGVMSS